MGWGLGKDSIRPDARAQDGSWSTPQVQAAPVDPSQGPFPVLTDLAQHCVIPSPEGTPTGAPPGRNPSPSPSPQELPWTPRPEQQVPLDPGEIFSSSLTGTS